MQRRTAGVIFLCIAAFLYGMRYLAAAIWGSGVTSWSGELFDDMLDYVGNGPVILSVIALIVGILYLILSEFEDSSMSRTIKRKLVKDLQQVKDNWNEIDKKG